MPHDRRFRFALDLHEPFPGMTLVESAREAEQLGYSTVFFPDHFDEGPGPLAAMAAVAVSTSTLKVGTLVLDCDFRHPAILARELATIDVLAEGRLEVGVGAGWKSLDYERSGIAMDRPGTRVGRLIEHTAVLKGLWAEGPFSFTGEHYTITELDGTPSPYTPGGPPILVGGGGPRLLRWAGQVADIVGVNASIHSGQIDEGAARDAQADRIEEKVGWLHEGAGERYADIEVNAWLAAAVVTEDPSVAEGVAALFGVDVEEMRRSPLALVGTLAEAAEQLEERRERWGYSYTVIPCEAAHDFAPLVQRLTGT
jgi:probable F420-dependent oxidoreductase